MIFPAQGIINMAIQHAYGAFSWLYDHIEYLHVAVTCEIRGRIKLFDVKHAFTVLFETSLRVVCDNVVSRLFVSLQVTRL
jgi:hypothetical protein